MFGLSVLLPGLHRLHLALPQQHYLVSAGLNFARLSPRKAPHLCMQGSGMDDRDDHLRWFALEEPPLGTALQITVTDNSKWTSPRRTPRRHIDWRLFFTRQKSLDQKRVDALKALLKRFPNGPPSTGSAWASHPPEVAFRVMLNGRDLGRIALEQPGSLSVTVFAKQRASRQVAELHVHGGVRLGADSWIWHKWPWAEHRLGLNDTVRIQIVPPRRIRPGTVRKDQRHAPADALVSELQNLRQRLTSDYYTREEALMLAYDEGRTARRTYPRRS